MSRFPTDVTPLRRPVLVAAFEGWNDAGDAASDAVEHLRTAWDGREVAALPPDDYYDFQVNRPTVSLVDGVTRRVTWPTTRVSFCSPPGADYDLVLVRGIEPNMRWRGFCDEIIEVVSDLQVHMAVNLGALLCEGKRCEEAVALFDEAVRRYPNEALLHFNRAVALEDQGRVRDALASYDAALHLDANLADAHYNAARLHEQMGDARKAVRHLSAYRRLQR